VRVASFNALHGLSVADGRADAARLAGACASLDADVLALQEVDRDQERSEGADQARAVAAATGAADWRFVPVLHGTPGLAWERAAGDRPGPAYGIALLSRLPVRWWKTLPLAGAPVRGPILVPGTRRLTVVKDEPRAVVCARVVAPFGEVTVAATHLSFVPAWNAWQLRRVVTAVCALPGPHLLMGDLNLPGRLPRLLSGWTPLVRGRTFPAPAPRLQLDHVLVSPGLRGHGGRAVELPVSDHRAVVAEVGPA
jgi:endonuclease/exonuclease/phosphatase family metal-dependent hydrolase